MGIKRLLIITTVLLVGAMFFDGLYQKDAPLMWLAATTVNYAYMRAALIAVLVMLLVTTPPRSINFRIFLAAFSSALFIGAVLLSYGYAIALLDAVVLIQVSIICMIEALEVNPAYVRKLGYNYTLVKKK